MKPYRTIKAKIKEKLESISSLQEVHDKPKLEFSGYPGAVIIPDESSDAYETNVEDEIIYAFYIAVFYETKNIGISEALDNLYDLVDDILITFIKDRQLSGIELPSDFFLLGVMPMLAGWRQIPDKDLLEARISLKVKVTYSYQ